MVINMIQEKYRPEGALIGSFWNENYTGSIQGLTRAIADGVIVEGEALRCGEGMRISVGLGGGVEGILERDEIQYTLPGEEMRDIAAITRVGKTVCFKVLRIEYTDGRPVAVLSRAEAQRECRENYISGLRTGDIIEARVTHLENFGAFVDIGCGIVSLLSIDCISVSRISHPRDRFRVGDRIPVVLRSIERGENGEITRISVSHRELLGTWEENAAQFRAGQTVAGIIRSVESYGVFIELAPNLAGLAEYRDDVEVGQCAAVYIKSIIPEKMKVKLVIVDTCRPETARKPLKYFVSGDHIDCWNYSPEVSPKIIGTDFSAETEKEPIF